MDSSPSNHGEGDGSSLNKPAAWGTTPSEKIAGQQQQQYSTEANDSSREPASALVDSSADVEQHCLLFPTYATRHSRSESKDPLDWNIRVRGWAFSKRSNRRKRLVMSMARKLAGVTKDQKLYETLESRFGMFLASNTQGARFSIQCVGPAEANHMELAGDPSSHDPTVDVLLSELDKPDAIQAAEEAAEDKTRLRMSLELDRNEGGGDIAGYTRLKNGDGLDQHPRGSRSDTANNSHQYTVDGAHLTRATSPESQEGSLSDRWSRGAALVKGTYRKYKPIVMAQVSSSGNYINSNMAVDSLKVPFEKHSKSPASTLTSSSASDNSGDNSGASTPRTAPFENTQRADSLDSITSQTETYDEDLGSDSDKDSCEVGGHPRFLKLHAYHPGMTEHCHGVVNLIDPEGISIISDIDDTIKETNVSAGARIILRNTFLKDMRDVPGMAKVYKQWWEHGAAIHYVSNSPWQLIPSLLEFFHTHKFPPGSAHLRLHDSVLKTYFMEPGENKRRSIREILKDFPKRKFILIGDSGEIDMEM
ncbi:hypothetical protein BGZ72_010372 [Mortierella alpina]|nr:hypothetical protein BGZ72_010372 [Mortierella alpina]